MTDVKNGRIMAPVAEAGGIARVMTSGQICATREALCIKLKARLEDKRFDEETRAMYAAQLKDVQAELKY